MNASTVPGDRVAARRTSSATMFPAPSPMPLRGASRYSRAIGPSSMKRFPPWHSRASCTTPTTRLQFQNLATGVPMRTRSRRLRHRKLRPRSLRHRPRAAAARSGPDQSRSRGRSWPALRVANAGAQAELGNLLDKVAINARTRALGRRERPDKGLHESADDACRGHCRIKPWERTAHDPSRRMRSKQSASCAR
jgi:hypothetical protein